MKFIHIVLGQIRRYDLRNVRVWSNTRTLGLPNASPTPANPVTTITSSGIRVHGIVCGFVSVKESHRSLFGPAWSRLPTLFLDPRWTEWLPIYVWVIEHPEGVIVVDTGETARVADPDYFDCDPGTAFIYRNMLRFSVREEEQLGTQLERLGIPTGKVRWLILTHLHSDHAGGLQYFSDAEILVSRKEFSSSLGAVRCRWPDWFDPSLVDYELQSVGPFKSTYSLTQAGDAVILPTPGHTPGHQSVVLLDDDRTIFFAGDTSFSEQQLLERTVGGISADVSGARTTLDLVLEYARLCQMVYLPSHDAKSGQRLAKSKATIPQKSDIANRKDHA